MIVKHLHSDNVVRNIQCMFSTAGVASKFCVKTPMLFLLCRRLANLQLLM